MKALKMKIQEIFGKYKFKDYLEYLRESQFYSSREILEIQKEKLKRLIHESYINIKFYHNFFQKNNLTPGDIIVPEDLRRLPVMTKDDYRVGFPEDFVNLNAPKHDLFPNSSSGSTGAPFKFYMTKLQRGNVAARFMRYYEWTGRRYGDLLVKIWGTLHPDLKTKIFHKYFENIYVINAFDLTEDNFISYYKKIKDKNVKLLEAYTSGAYAFAQLLKTNDLYLDIPATILSGETLFEFQKKIIQTRFNTEIYNRYGCREFGAIAQECSEHTGLHISQEDFIIEILDENLAPVEDGEIGNIYVTSLDNYSMPLIRYKIDDRGSFTNEICPCGRNLKMFGQVEGRVSDIIVSPSGKHISLYYFALLFQERSETVKEFQVQQKEGSDELLILIVPTAKYNSTIEADIIKHVKNLDDSFVITVKSVKKIPLEPTGKKKYFKIIKSSIP
jgi:phenylacetate-CoA ligase